MNRDDPRYSEIGIKPGRRLDRAVAAYHGKSEVDLDRFEDAADVFCGMATLHGMATLVLEEKAAHFFPERDFPGLREKGTPQGA